MSHFEISRWALAHGFLENRTLARGRLMRFLFLERSLLHFHKGREIMATRWFYKVHEKVIGPLESDELLRKVRRGDITEGTQVRKNDSAWFPAKDVNGLFEAAFKDHPEKAEKTVETEYHGD